MARQGGGRGRGGRGKRGRGGRNAVGKSAGGPRLASSLLKAIGVAGNRRTDRESSDAEDEEEVKGDVYEYEEGVPEEERGKNKRFDEVERLEYELPSDFEDEEIDEDAASGGGGSGEEASEDESKFFGAAKGRRSKEIDLNSDEDDEAEEESDEEDMEEDEYEDGGEENSDGSGDGGDEEEGVDDQEDDEESHRRMIEAVTGKSFKTTADREGKPRKARVVTEAYPESEFNLNPSSANDKSNITVEDLMNPLHDATGFSALRKRMQQLQRRGTPVAAPLPRIIQERVDRKAGYDETRTDITKWQPVIKRNREAPSLVFNEREVGQQVTTLAAHITPTTDLEKEIHELLRKSNLGGAQLVSQAEDLELNKLTVEEVRERQERLAKMRSLLFQHEAKSKRVRKIKSKTYHRLLHKGQKADIADISLAEADPEASKEAAMKQEFKRAQERMTLKHKNQSKWAKRILKRGRMAQENDGTRDAIAEQLRTHATLTRKIHSATFSGSETSSSSDDEVYEEDGHSGLVLQGKRNAKVLAKAKVATLKALEDGEERDLPGTGLFALPFMARAIEKKKKTAELEAMAVLKQLERAEEEGNFFGLDDDYNIAENEEKDKTTLPGKMSFGDAKQPATRVNTQKLKSDVYNDMDNNSSDEEMLEKSEPNVMGTGEDTAGKGSTRTADAMTTNQYFEDHSRKQARDHERAEDGLMNVSMPAGKTASMGVESVPVREVVVKKAKQSGKAKKLQVTKLPEKPSPMIVNPAQKAVVKIAGQPILPQVIKDTADNSLSYGNRSGLILNEAFSGVVTDAEVKVTDAEAVLPSGDAVVSGTFSDDDSDEEEQGLPNGIASQEDLIRQAFAGDDVEAEFEQLKAQALDEEVPQGEGPISLPGWGQWTHVQKKKGQPAWVLKEQDKIKKEREKSLGKRKDAKLKYVIISEKQDKKAAKFTSPSLPFPYKSKEVFESSIRMPIGREFNTDKVFRDMIRPSVLKSSGVIIEPIEPPQPTDSKDVDSSSQSAKRRKHQIKPPHSSAIKEKADASSQSAKRRRHG